MLQVLMCVLLISSFGWSQQAPAPNMSWDERLGYFTQRTFAWQRLGLMAGDTAFEHLLGEPREWGRDPHTFANRYSARFGKRLVRNSIELGAGALFREDIRYQPSGMTGFGRRLRFALLQSVLAADGGFAYSRLAGNAGAVLVSSNWYPGGFTGRRAVEGIAFGFLGQLENSLLTEFSPDLKTMGRRFSRGLLRRGAAVTGATRAESARRP